MFCALSSRWRCKFSFLFDPYTAAAAGLSTARVIMDFPRSRRLMSVTCNRCQDVCWVCEKHLDRPHASELANGCECRAGVPCPDCQPNAGRSVRRVRGRPYSHVSSSEPTEYTFELSGHSPAPMSPSSSATDPGLSSEPARAPPPQRANVAVRAQLRRR